MGEDSKIEWTDHTFNPWIGCTKVSPGCQFCYAEKESNVHRGKNGKKASIWAEWGKGKPRQRTSLLNWEKPLKWNDDAAAAGARKTVFCASLADVFDSEVDTNWRQDLWDLIRVTPHLIWMLLTKRSENIQTMLPRDWGDGWENVCLMVSIEDQERLERLSHLARVPSKLRALSMEPLLGFVDLSSKFEDLQKIDLVIVGGESGPEARPMNPNWATHIAENCQSAGTVFFFKQWGNWGPVSTLDSTSSKRFAIFEENDGKARIEKDRANVKGLLSSKPDGTQVLAYSRGKKTWAPLLNGTLHQSTPFAELRALQSEIILNPQEKDKLQECEQIIRNGFSEFVKVGQALMTISRSRLYRATHNAFEEYLRDIIGISRPRAYELMGSAEVMKDLSGIPDIARLPENEAQANELKKLKPEERKAKWIQVIEQAGDAPITAKLIRETVGARSSSSTTGDSVPSVKTNEQRIAVALKKVRSLSLGTNVADEVSELLNKIETLLIKSKAGKAD